MKITCHLSAKSVKEAQKQLTKYKRELKKRCETFVRRLAELGIRTAYNVMDDDEISKYLIFDRTLEPTQYGARGVMYATQTGMIRSEWRTLNNASGIETADVSPLLMAEFGAGIPFNQPGNPRAGEFGMGPGTFPGQTHAMNPDGWWYMDLDYEWHHVYGIEASMPMTIAAIDMRNDLFTVARDVFGKGVT